MFMLTNFIIIIALATATGLGVGVAFSSPCASATYCSQLFTFTAPPTQGPGLFQLKFKSKLRLIGPAVAVAVAVL